MRDVWYAANFGTGKLLPREKILLVANAVYDPSPTDQFQRVVVAAEEVGLHESDLMPFSFILTTAGANQNNQYFVEDELALPAIYQSPIGQAIDVDHVQSFDAIQGEIYDSLFMEAGALGRDQQGMDMPAAIKSAGYVFQKCYPETAFKVRRGAGRWAAVSMEAYPNPLEQIGKYMVIHMPDFIGAGLVRFPGNVLSQITEVGGDARHQEYRELVEGLHQALANSYKKLQRP